jgi:hypothetical protein
MHQEDYIQYLLDEHGMSNCNAVALPMDPNFPFGRSTDVYPHIDELETEYRKLVGELLYLAMYTRPDIAFAVMRLAQHNSSAKPCHYSAAKHVLRYLSSTIHLKAHYGGSGINPALHGFSDSDWASCPEDRVSISGYVWFFNGGPVSHSAKKQTTHALSSCEAEYMALTAAVQDGLWLQSFFACVTIPLSLPLRLFADNAGAIALSQEAANHIRTKHIDLRYHFIRRHIEEGTFLPVWLSTHKNHIIQSKHYVEPVLRTFKMAVQCVLASVCRWWTARGVVVVLANTPGRMISGDWPMRRIGAGRRPKLVCT